MTDAPKQHYRILYYRGTGSITGISDLFIEMDKAPPENCPGSFIISDAEAKPLDWDTLKETDYVKSLHPLTQRAIENSIKEELAKSARPVSGKQAMILDTNRNG